MRAEGRRLLYRIETRIAQACGRELADRDTNIRNRQAQSIGDINADDAWAAGLIRAWKQIRRLRETGEVVNVDEEDRTVTIHE